MTADETIEIAAERTIVEMLRVELGRIAVAAGATLQEDTADLNRGGILSPMFRLSSATRGTGKIEVMPEGAWSIYIAVGEKGFIEVFASSEKPARGVRSAIAIVEAIVAGRLKERVWRSRRSGRVVGSALRIRYEPDARWRVIGRVGAVAPLIGRLLYRCEVIHYRPFRNDQ
jgi:hypothetical protein